MTFQCHACFVPLSLDEARADDCLICGAELNYNLDLPPAQRRKLELSGIESSVQHFVDPPHSPWPAASQSAWRAATPELSAHAAADRQFVLVVLDQRGERLDQVPLPADALSDLPAWARRLQPGRYAVMVQSLPGAAQTPAATGEQKLIELDVRIERTAGEASDAAVSVIESSGRTRPLDDASWRRFWRNWESLCESLEDSDELVRLASTASITQTTTIGVRHQRRESESQQPTAAGETTLQKPNAGGTILGQLAAHPTSLAVTPQPAGAPTSDHSVNTLRIDSAMAAFGRQPQSKAARLARWISRHERDR